MSGAISPLPHAPSWWGRGKFATYLGSHAKVYASNYIKAFDFNYICELSTKISVIFRNTSFKNNLLSCFRNLTSVNNYTQVHMSKEQVNCEGTNVDCRTEGRFLEVITSNISYIDNGTGIICYCNNLEAMAMQRVTNVFFDRGHSVVLIIAIILYIKQSYNTTYSIS